MFQYCSGVCSPPKQQEQQEEEYRTQREREKEAENMARGFFFTTERVPSLAQVA